MSTKIPDNLLSLFTTNVVVALATVMPGGQPQVNPVWCGFDGTHILVNSAKGRVKDKNMRERAQVTVLALDPQNPYRWCEVRGTVAEVTEEGANAMIDDFAERYLGKRPYPWHNPAETRVVYKILPTRVISMGN